MTSEKCGGCLLIAVSMCLVKAGLDVVGQDAETQIAVIQISRCVGVYVMDKNGWIWSSVVMEDLKKEKKNALYKYQAICVCVVGKKHA